MHKLLIISGPTATGKTSLALSVAKKFKGELVSADSRQVYRGMDIVTGKEIDKDVKTWLLDVVDPDQPFAAAQYYELAWETIRDIWKRGKLPILVGGTGFYMKAVVDGIDTMGIKPNWELRRELEELTVKELGEELKRLDPKRWKQMNESDRKNPRRLIRAVEILNSRLHLRGVKLNQPSYMADTLWIGLTTDFQMLYGRIDERVDERLHMGAVEETRQLAKKFGWYMPSMTGQGYRQLRGLVEGKISLEETVQRWKFAEHEYARKQMTWFRKEKRIVWFTISDKNFEAKVEKMVREWYIKE